MVYVHYTACNQRCPILIAIPQGCGEAYKLTVLKYRLNFVCQTHIF